jgi:hypothetical protein
VLAALPEIASYFEHPVEHAVAAMLAAAAGEQAYDVTITPLHDRHGRVSGQLLSLHDASTRLKAEADQRFLISIGAVLGSSLDYAETLHTITQLAVPTLADMCAIHIRERDGLIRQVALMVADEDLRPLAGSPRSLSRMPSCWPI